MKRNSAGTRDLPYLLLCMVSVVAVSLLFLISKGIVYSVATLFAAPLVALFFLARKPDTPERRPSPPEVSRGVLLGLGVLFLVSTALALLLAHNEPISSPRPWLFFALIFCGSFSIISQILIVNLRRSAVLWICAQIILLLLTLQISEYFLYPSVVGIDPWWHLGFTNNLLNQGHIPQGFSYSGLPNMHILIVTVQELTGVDYKMGAFLGPGLALTVLNPLLILLLGSKIFGTREGLLASVLLSSANYYLAYSIDIIPNSFAATLSLLALSILFLFQNRTKYPTTLMLLIVFIALILTHALASFILLVAMSTLWLMRLEYRTKHRVLSLGRLDVLNLNTVLLFGIEMFGWWTYVSGHLSDIALAIKWGFNLDLISGFDTARWSAFASHASLTEQIFSSASLLGFLGLAGAGVLYVLTGSSFSSSSKGLALMAALLSGVGILSQQFGVWLASNRWLYFGQILLVLPVGALILGVVRGSSTAIKTLASLILSSLILLAVLSPQANSDYFYFTPNITVRHSLTDSELASAQFANNKWSGKVSGDAYYGVVEYLGLLEGRYNRIDDQLSSGSTAETPDSMIVVRDYWHGHPVLSLPGQYFVRTDVTVELSSAGWSTVYSSGSVSLLVRTT